MALLTEVLEATGYTRRHPSNCDEGQIRRLVLRMGLKAEDVRGLDGDFAADFVEGSWGRDRLILVLCSGCDLNFR